MRSKFVKIAAVVLGIVLASPALSIEKFDSELQAQLPTSVASLYVDVSILCPIRQQFISNFPCASRFASFPASLSTARATVCRRPKRMPLCHLLAAPPERLDGGGRLGASVDFPVVRSGAFAWHVAI